AYVAHRDTPTIDKVCCSLSLRGTSGERGSFPSPQPSPHFSVVGRGNLPRAWCWKMRPNDVLVARGRAAAKGLFKNNFRFWRERRLARQPNSRQQNRNLFLSRPKAPVSLKTTWAGGHPRIASRAFCNSTPSPRDLGACAGGNPP